MTKSRLAPALSLAGMLIVGLAVCASALAHGASGGAGHIYWANTGNNSIGRADLDLSVPPDQSFITGATTPHGVAIDGTYAYWTHDLSGGSIGRAPLDASTVPNQSFLAAASSPQGIALDATSLYWTHTVSGAGKVGTAKLNASSPNPSFVSTGSAPCGVAVEADKLYWGNGGTPGSIGRSHGPFSVDQSFITATQNPCGVAVTDQYVYWTNRDNKTIGRATLDGTTEVKPAFISTASAPCGVAVDGGHVYWTGGNAIGRADLDGMNPNDTFITGASSPCGLAVSPSFSVTPLSNFFADTAVGGQSDIQVFSLTNTSTSVLDVSDASFVGANPSDFEKTGDGCTGNHTPSRFGCLFNVRFTPTATGLRTAVLRVTSNASNSPVDIVLAGTGTAAASAPAPGGARLLDQGASPLPVARDATAPRFRSASLSRFAFRVDGGGLAEVVAALEGTGTTFHYSLSEPARVVFNIQRRLPGTRVGRRCVPLTPSNRDGHRCTRWVGSGRFARSSLAGGNAKHFSGRIGRGRLVPGDYRVGLVAIDAAGNISKARFLHFRVVR